jgi:hypothetical protein
MVEQSGFEPSVPPMHWKRPDDASLHFQQKFSTEERRELRASGEGLVSRSDPVQFSGENPKLAGIGHFARHERDRRFESTLLPPSSLRCCAFSREVSVIPTCVTF